MHFPTTNCVHQDAGNDNSHSSTAHTDISTSKIDQWSHEGNASVYTCKAAGSACCPKQASWGQHK
eukprot:1154476-Pelagomonas_calceolata.AAC.6